MFSSVLEEIVDDSSQTLFEELARIVALAETRARGFKSRSVTFAALACGTL